MPVTSGLHYLPARELLRLLRSRQVSARDVVQAHLERIELTNPAVNAVVTLIAERALDEAAAADQRLSAGAQVGPLHGLPILHKDTHATAGVRTTSGSPLYAEHVPQQDELIVERSRAAGAISLGKTNVPEFAAGSHTFNTLFGLTRNPYDLSRSAGGSSGGAAAALACGMAPLADGSDLGGSLRNPASFCNVVGLRPSLGRVPTWPSELPWSSLAVQGPMARTVDDVALLLSVLAGPDPRSPVALSEPGERFADPLTRPGELTGLRVAWSPDLGGAFAVDPEVLAVLETRVEVFATLGCRVEAAFPDLSGADEVFRTLRGWAFAHTLGPLRDQRPEAFKASLLWNIDQGRQVTSEDLARAESLRLAIFHRVREFFAGYDVLLMPVSQVLPFDADLEYPDQVAGVAQHTYLDWMRSCYLISVTGCPALSVPAGFSANGLPVGLQVVGPHRADLRVLQVGHAFEQATEIGSRHPVRPAQADAPAESGTRP